MKTNLTIAANAYPFKLILNAANYIKITASTPIRGGNTSGGVASGMRSVETHVQLSFGWTHEDLWLRVYRKSVVAVPMEVAPRARRCRVRGQSTFDRIRQPQTDGLTRLLIYFIRCCWGKQYFQIATLQQANFIAIIYTLHRWTQFIISKQSYQLFKKLEISSLKVPNR